VNEMKTNITHVNGKTDKNKMAIIQLTIMILNTRHLRRIVDRLKKIPDVYTVTRTIN
jgi:GTP diphosphokinase / guanosine-3',5'-bis(diphosphate) 3'-diphosphatase